MVCDFVDVLLDSDFESFVDYPSMFMKDPYLSHSPKLKFKYIKVLNIKPDMLNSEKVGNSLRSIGTGDIFLNKHQ